ncbi:MAG: hypothetical protein ACKVYV_00960 [Limisphaerales bacterium]
MLGLTRQQQVAITVLLLLLIAGWAAKAWREGRVPQSPPPTAAP